MSTLGDFVLADAIDIGDLQRGNHFNTSSPRRRVSSDLAAVRHPREGSGWTLRPAPVAPSLLGGFWSLAHDKQDQQLSPLRGDFISFDERQKKRSKEKRWAKSSLAVIVAVDIFRLGLLPRSENGAHPCAPPSGCAGDGRDSKPVQDQERDPCGLSLSQARTRWRARGGASRYGAFKIGRSMRPALLLLALCASPFAAHAQDLLIRNATVHTGTSRGTLRNADVLVAGGTIRAVGTALTAPANAQVVDALGRPLTPTLFGGITEIGLEEVSGERTTVDETLALGAATKQMVVRPEFDVTLAYNPASTLVPVARMEGIGWTLLGAGSSEGGSIVGGQGAVVRLDGSPDPLGPKVLFVDLGSDAAELTGRSRAAQWMLLDQLVDEVRGRIGPDSHAALLTPAGRATFARYLDGGGRVVVGIDRAADIRQLLRWSRRHGVRVAIAGGAEAWMLAADIAAADVPVFVNPLANLPASFDAIGASMQAAARLHAAGVAVGFSEGGAAHNARKVRQLAGNAVAAGLPWDAALAGLTRVPARAFGVGDAVGGIAPGQRADLVLWTGDPLDVAHVAAQVWMDGRAMPMRSRQTDLRDRYLRPGVAADAPR